MIAEEENDYAAKAQSSPAWARMNNNCNLLLLTLWACSLGKAQYHTEAIDCLTPTAVEKYQRNTICSPVNKTSETQPYLLVQERRMREFTGYSCQLTYSQWALACGVWSHVKLRKIPEISHMEDVSKAWCRAMSERKKFRVDGTSTSYAIKINRENIYPIVTVGSLREENDRIICQGQTIHENNRVHTNAVIMREYKLLVKQEDFTLDNEGRIESTFQHEKLPCSLGSGGCITGARTYVFNIPKEECPLQYIQTVHMKPTRQSYLVDEKKNILLNQTQETRIPGCSFSVIQTQFSGLYLAKGNDHSSVTELSSSNLEIDLMDRMSNEMNQYYREQIVADLQLEERQRTCDKIKNSEAHRPVQVKDLQYALAAGDIIYRFQCRKVQVQIQELESCYEDVPVTGNRYMDPLTKLLKTHSAKRPCSHFFPITIKVGKGFVEVNPHLKRAEPPKVFVPGTELLTKHVDRSQSGVYTQKELRAWELLLTLPNFQDALLNEVSWGTCISSGNCNGPIQADQRPQWKLDSSPFEEMNLWGYLKKKVRDYGDELALAVILYLILKMIINLALLSFALLKEGPGAALALLVALYASNQQAYSKIRRRNQRMKKEQARRRNKPQETEPDQEMQEDTV